MVAQRGFVQGRAGYGAQGGEVGPDGIWLQVIQE
jgi:hypothetical protein